MSKPPPKSEADAPAAIGPFVIVCRGCHRPLTAQREWVGRDVQCPHCATVCRVPEPGPAGQPAKAGRPNLAPKLQFNFPCPRCDTLLEAHTGICRQPARCPTCGANLVVPEVSRRTGKPRKAELRDDGGADPTPLHAYAASGTQAPQIVRLADGSHAIECPRCAGHCEIDVDVCPACGTPFTMEAAPTVGSYTSQERAQATLVLGVLSLPLFFLVLPALAALVVGLLSLRIGRGEPPRVGAIVGMIMAVLSLAGAATMLLL